MSSIKRLICMVLLLATAALAGAAACAVPAFAGTVSLDDYEVCNPVWDERDDGRIIGIWDEPEAKTSYLVILCKTGHRYNQKKNKNSERDQNGEKTLTESIMKWTTTSSNHYDFSRVINQYGTGDYYFIVIPKKVYTDKELYPYDRLVTSSGVIIDDPGEMMVKSSNWKYDSDQKKVTSAAIKAEDKYLDETRRYPKGWVEELNGEWKYADESGQLVKNTWVEDNGKKYFIDTKGYMVRGWQAVKSKMYYFGTDGAMYVNTTTPDGKTVNGAGELVENGKVVSSSEYKKKNKTSIVLSIVEDSSVLGSVMPISFKESKDYDIANITYSHAPSEWREGSNVMISMDLIAKPEVGFDNNVKVTCSGSTVEVNTGDKQRRHVEIKYMPKIKLPVPEVSVDNEGVLWWNKVKTKNPHNIKYKITCNVNNQNYNNTTTSASFDIKTLKEKDSKELFIEKIPMDVVGVTVKITASGDKSKYIKTSDAFVIDDLAQFIEEHGNEGRLKDTGKNTFYVVGADDVPVKDAAGNVIQTWKDGINTGWIQHDGVWYYFDEKGRAIKNAWFQDPESGKWYYFDNEGRMLVNTTTPDGYTVGPDGACQ